MPLFCAVASALVVGAGAAVAQDVDPDNCLAAPYSDVEGQEQEAVRALVAEVRVALKNFPALEAALAENGPDICRSGDLVAERGYFDAEENRIVLASEMSPGLALAVLVHELRHARQFAVGVCPSDDLAMKEYARATFAIEADANVASMVVAWHRKTGGNPDMWEAIRDWPMTADIADRFAMAMEGTDDVANAAAAAFDQWYGFDRRTDIYYVASCSAYLDRMDDTHALPQYRVLGGTFFDELCLLPDGQEYDCREALVRGE